MPVPWRLLAQDRVAGFGDAGSQSRAANLEMSGFGAVGRALDSVWWQHMSRFQKSGVRGATGARCLSSILAGMVAVGGRP